MKRLEINRSLRMFFWGTRLFLTRRKLPIVLFSGAVLFLIIFVRFFKPPQRTLIFKVGFIAQVSSPSDLPGQISEVLSSGLTSLNPDGEAVANLAIRWEQNNEGSQFIFFLKPNIFWQNGEKLVSSDLKFDIPDTSVSYPTDDKVVFELKNPFSPFSVFVSRPVFKDGAFLGTGPCQVTKIEKKEEIIDRLLVSCPNQNSLLDVRFYPREEDGLTALNLGEIKALFGVRELGKKQNWPNFNFYKKGGGDRFVAVFYNLRNPILEEKKVRQALALSIPKDGLENRAFGPINPNSWAYNENLKEYNFDIEEAKKLLEEVDAPFEMNLWTTAPYLELARRIARSWENLGISVKVETKTVDEAALKEFQALLIGQEISPDPDQYSLWHSTQETNITGLESPKIDKYLEDGRETFDKVKRKEIYQDFQKYLVEECPAAFLYYPQEYILVAKKADTPILHQIFNLP